MAGRAHFQDLWEKCVDGRRVRTARYGGMTGKVNLTADALLMNAHLGRDVTNADKDVVRLVQDRDVTAL